MTKHNSILTTTTHPTFWDIDEYYGVLTDLDVDVSHLDQMQGWVAKERILGGQLKAFRDGAGSDLGATASDLALNQYAPQDAITRALSVALAGTDEVKDTVAAVFAQAQAIARRKMARSFKAAMPTTLEHLKAKLTELLETLVANKIDPGITTVEVAARHGLEVQWFALERAHARYVAIDNILRAFAREGYADATLTHTNVEAMRRYAVRAGAQGVWLANVAEESKPAILTAAEAAEIARSAPVVTDQAAQTEQRIARRRTRDAENDAKTGPLKNPKPKTALGKPARRIA